VFTRRKKRKAELAAGEPAADTPAISAPTTTAPATATPAIIAPAITAPGTADAPPGALKGKRPGKPPKTRKPSKPKGRPIRKGPARQTRTTRLVGLAFCVGGFVTIGFGWAGAAAKDCVECQMPFLLSGGAAGLGLIVFGIGMMLMAQMRTEGRRLAERLEAWRSSTGPAEAPGPPAQDIEASGVASEGAAGATPGPNGALPLPAANPQPQRDEARSP
jgi:hypothetical protein